MESSKIKADRNDLNTAIVVGALVIAWLLFDGIRRIVELFGTAGSVTVTTRVPAQEITAAIGDGAPAIVDSATLVVADVNTVSIISLVLAITLRALCLIAVAVLGVVLCRRLMRGILFDRVNTRLTFAMSIGLLAAGLIGPWFENMGLNGVVAALGGEFDYQRWLLFSDGIPLFVAAIAVGVLVIVFRRGTALQKDAEGLV
ncbi:hypothetical protein [Microbacterium sp. AK031]|uniref:hypothetical protein n=1 Tax=Microbacterium sp. AK031 TaxID=2723076 RepID=UPI002169E532|nr:hypothetical protein [Microbacterium sp. AK031]MCS3843010.1 uncharacterized protein YneF (UPF0154 family) [Microbacterium sp. AK031]